jgi:TetR/AcrR family transcriptional regulator, transcriptional repressor for nem operon
MPHPKDRKARTRQRILESAGRSFATRGFDATSIEQLMFECGLTRGGFYAHFKSKAHLYEEALRDGHLARLASMPVDPSNDWLRHVFAACSGDAPISSDWTFLATDAASAKPEIRESYLRAVDTMTRKLAEHLQPRAPDSSDDVPLAAAAMLIGAMAIASSVDSPRAKTAFVTACRNTLQRLSNEGHQSFFWTVEHPVA